MSRRAASADLMATRTAVSASVGDLAPGDRVVVACSGGPDSLALAAAAAWVGERMNIDVRAVVVDHGLQDGSDGVALDAADACRALGIPAGVVRVEVGRQGGPEAAARTARYEALESAAAVDGRGGGPAGPHPGRPGGDRAAAAGEGLRGAVARRDGGPHRPVAPALPGPATVDRPCRGPGGAGAAGSHGVDGSAQWGSRLRSGPRARPPRRPDDRPGAGGRARPGEVGGPPARRRGPPRRAGRDGARARGRARRGGRPERRLRGPHGPADSRADPGDPPDVPGVRQSRRCARDRPRATRRRARDGLAAVRGTSRCRAVSRRRARMEG